MTGQQASAAAIAPAASPNPVVPVPIPAQVPAKEGIADLSGASSPQPADLDGDGDLDVAVVSADNNWDDPAAPSLVWLENDGQMRFAVHDVAHAPTHLVTLAAGDLTGDGLVDLVTGGLHASRPYDRMSRVTLWTNGWPRR